jgi:hypothetical protein
MKSSFLEHLQKKLSREYREIAINRRGEKKVEYRGHYPDMILGNHGIVLAILSVETTERISDEISMKML